MLHFVEWTFLLYVVLKVCQLLFGPGGRRDAPLSARLRAGEPMLMIATFGGSALLIAFGTWWQHRFLEGHYERSADCYGKLTAAKQLPGLPARFRSFDAADAVDQLRWSAQVHGSQLGLREADIDHKLEQERFAYAASYARLAATNAPRALPAAFDDLDRCLNGEGRHHGELLRP
jgi:hypothetical protein